MSSCQLLFINGAVSEAPPVFSFLETHPGAYTTSRTHLNGSCILFWDKHLLRLANSARLLCNPHPELFFKSGKSVAPFPVDTSFWESTIQSLVDESVGKTLPVALNKRKSGDELAITVLVCGDSEKLKVKEDVGGDGFFRALDVCVHIGAYVPPLFCAPENAAHLAVAGFGRDVAAAKYSNWARQA